MSEILRPDLPNTNREAEKIVERMLHDIRQGKITSVGVVAVSPLGQISSSASGMQGEMVYMGLDMLRTNLLSAVMGRRVASGAV